LGHTLITQKRNDGSFFELAPEERSELLALLDHAKVVLGKEFMPHGYYWPVKELY
jgi:diadenosine tetraphosphate (Ap4A) HIT family hydrolase